MHHPYYSPWLLPSHVHLVWLVQLVTCAQEQLLQTSTINIYGHLRCIYTGLANGQPYLQSTPLLRCTRTLRCVDTLSAAQEVRDFVTRDYPLPFDGHGGNI